MGKAGKKFKYKNIEYDSPEETYFTMWLEGLQDAGFVKKWERTEKSMELTKAVYNDFIIVSGLKKTPKEKKQTLLQALTYCPDFIITWNKKAKYLFYNELYKKEKIECFFIADNNVSIVEIKPSFDKNNMTRLFRQIQKFIFSTQKKYINLIFIEKLFSETYTPYPFLFTKTGKKKVISKWTVRSLEEFLKIKND